MEAYQHQQQPLVGLSVCSLVPLSFFPERVSRGSARTHRLIDTVLWSLPGALSLHLIFSYPLLVMSVVTLIRLDCCARHRLWRKGGVPFSLSRRRSVQSGEVSAVVSLVWTLLFLQLKVILRVLYKFAIASLFQHNCNRLLLFDLTI